MWTLGPVAFLNPGLLGALVALPILWWLLRAVPPAPARRAFPGVRLLLGLRDPERMPEKTPWWLLLLRMLALGAAIAAFANPVLNPKAEARGDGPLLILMDGSWASAPDWQDRLARVSDLLEGAERAGRPTAVQVMSTPLPPEGLRFRQASAWSQRLSGLRPRAWAADRTGVLDWAEDSDTDGFETVWITDGLSQDGDGPFLDGLAEFGPVSLIRSDRTTLALTPPKFEDGAVRVEVLRAQTDRPAPPVKLAAIGLDPLGIERRLGEAEAIFGPDEKSVEVSFELPLELRNRITRIAIPQERSAGAVTLSDDGLKRRKIGLIAGRASSEEQRLTSSLHFLRKALEPSADLIEASIDDILGAVPDVLIMADVGTVSNAEREKLVEWIEAGGLLIRFAGPRLAQSGEGRLDDDPLLPVRLLAGGRSVGGTMSWGAPKSLRPFPESSPFFGLSVPEEVDVTSQVMAQPDPNLPERVMAALEDGTPLVTGRSQGDGRVVLFHVTSNAEWSSLPLSFLFVQMLERLAVSTRSAAPEATDLEGEIWTAKSILNGFGEIVEPELLPGIDGSRLIEDTPSAEMPPGIYQAGERQFAVNLFRTGDVIFPLGTLPAFVQEETMGVVKERVLKPLLLLLGLGLLAFDVLATLWVAGRLSGPRAAQAAGIALALILLPGQMKAQSEDDLAIYATTETVLAYVRTGDTRVDQISEAGLKGLTLMLNRRTAIEPVDPVAIDLETDELAFFPFIYWPISEAQELPSEIAYAKLNTYVRSGGMILFDTRDANLGQSFGMGTPNGRMLRRLAGRLDIPALEPAPLDHVLTRTFYILQDFPGRYARSEVWVEAAPVIEEVEGMPFRNLNDGVTPVVIGGNDWAAAWAIDENGAPMFPVGRGAGGAQQRELAYRFGINLIMHVMTGNYKSDQVHVPALLERLGQ